MSTILYDRIKELCSKNGITISKLESELDFGVSSIKKWEYSSSPSVDKVLKIATYFNVSVDYLLGRTDIEGSISDILEDKDVISFQRARQKATPKDREKMMKILSVTFDYAFADEISPEVTNTND